MGRQDSIVDGGKYLGTKPAGGGENRNLCHSANMRLRLRIASLRWFFDESQTCQVDRH